SSTPTPATSSSTGSWTRDAAPAGYDTYEARLTPDQRAIIRAFKGKDDVEKEVVHLLNAVIGTHVHPNVPILSYFWYRKFGSHCVRWTNTFQKRLLDLPGATFGRRVWMDQYTLRYPRTGGPEHSVVLVRLRGVKGAKVFGIDNGALGGDDRLFDPSTVIKDT